MKTGYVYIITNLNHSVVYIGVTSNIQKRLFEHQTKVRKCFSSKYNLNKLVFIEEYKYLTEAILREKQLKSRNRARKNKLISDSNPSWKAINVWR